MNSNGLEQSQIQRLLDQVKRELHYFTCLEGRMHQRHFPDGDPLYVRVKTARAAIVELSAELEQLLRKVTAKQ